jgi:tetratricopeptide (TPR) repeat protein
MVLALWAGFLVVWAASLVWIGGVHPAATAGAAAALAILNLVAPGTLKLSKPARVALIAVGAIFLVQLLPLSFLFPNAAELRRIHGVGTLWPATADTYLTVKSLAQVALYVLTGLLVLRLRDAGLPSSVMLKGIVAILVLEGAYALAQVSIPLESIPFYGKRAYPEASGTLVNRNSFAGLMGMGLAVAAAVAAGRFAWSRERRLEAGLPWALAAVLFVVAVIVTRSRGGALAAAAGIALLPFVLRDRAAGVALAGIVAAAAVVFFAADPEPLLERFEQVDPHEIERQDRWAYARTTAEAAMRQPVLGFGIGTHPAAYHPFQPPTILGDLHHAHSEPVNVFFEAGAMGVVVVVAAFAAWAVRAWRAGRRMAARDRVPLCGALAVAGVVAVHGLVDFDLRIPSVGMLFAVMVGLAGSYGREGAAPARLTGWAWAAVGFAAAGAAAFLGLDSKPLADEALRSEPEKAEVLCRRALGLSPYDYRAAWALARVEQRRGRASEADRRFEVAADLWPAHAAVQREAGLWFWEGGQLERAARCLGRLFAQRPWEVAGVMEEIWEAGREVADYERLTSGLPAAVARLAGFLAGRGEWRRGMEVFERGCPATAANVGAYDVFAGTLARGGQWGLEAAVRDRRLEARSDPAAWLASGEAWLKLGALEEARTRAEQAVRVDLGSAGAWSLKARVLGAKGERAGALESWAEAVRLGPGDYGVRAGRARYHGELGMHAAAADDWRAALASKPGDRSATLGLGGTLMAQGQATQARALLTEWLQRNPDDSAIRRLLSGQK